MFGFEKSQQFTTAAIVRRGVTRVSLLVVDYVAVGSSLRCSVQLTTSFFTNDDRFRASVEGSCFFVWQFFISQDYKKS